MNAPSTPNASLKDALNSAKWACEKYTSGMGMNAPGIAYDLVSALRVLMHEASAVSETRPTECRGFLPGADPEQCVWCGVKISQHQRPNAAPQGVDDGYITGQGTLVDAPSDKDASERLRLAMLFIEEWANYWAFALDQPAGAMPSTEDDEKAESFGKRAADMVIDNRRYLANAQPSAIQPTFDQVFIAVQHGLNCGSIDNAANMPDYQIANKITGFVHRRLVELMAPTDSTAATDG